MRHHHLAAVALALLGAAGVTAQSTLDAPRGEKVPFVLDSGLRANLGNAPEVVFEQVVHVEDSAWLRLYFGEQTELGRGSRIRVTSMEDDEVHELDLATLERWSRTTGYFNGDAVIVQLIAGPKTTRNRLFIEEIALEFVVVQEAGLCGICGVDNRVSSSENWAGRILPTGCSAAVYNEQSCVVSAGHCMSAGMTMQFNVPLSDPNCNLNHPPLADQFPITAWQSNNGGVGQDWAVMTSGNNSVGQSIVDRYGEFRTINVSLPLSGQPLDIWGYGTDTECVVSQTQQHSTGSVVTVSGLFFEHNADATGGNSGSAVLRADQIIGIATHCPCPNIATRVSHPAFIAARDELCQIATGGCCLSDGACNTASEFQCNGAGGVYLGDDVACDPNPCPQPTGACCFGEGSCVDATAATCDLIAGTYQGDDTLCGEVACDGGAPCPWDLDGDSVVGFADLLSVLANWGPCAGCPEDFDGDNQVAFADLLATLANWGPCP